MSTVTQKRVTIESSSKDSVNITVIEEDNGKPGICTTITVPLTDLKQFIKSKK